MCRGARAAGECALYLHTCVANGQLLRVCIAWQLDERCVLRLAVMGGKLQGVTISPSLPRILKLPQGASSPPAGLRVAQNTLKKVQVG